MGNFVLPQSLNETPLIEFCNVTPHDVYSPIGTLALKLTFDTVQKKERKNINTVSLVRYNKLYFGVVMEMHEQKAKGHVDEVHAN